MSSIYTTISLIGFVLMALFFIAAIAVFFAMDIPNVIADLNGKNAAKQVAIIREQSKNAVYSRTERVQQATERLAEASANVAEVAEDECTVVLGSFTVTKSVLVVHTEEMI